MRRVVAMLAGLGTAMVIASAGFAVPDASAAVAPGQAFGSDDFAAGVLDPRWAVVDPLGDGTVSFVGVGSSDVRLGLGVPAGVSHDAWGVNNSLRVTQSAVDTDFTAVSSFTSVPALRYQSQGLLVEQDAANWLRFDVHHTGATLRAFASRTVGGSSTVALSRNITAAGPIGLRVSRAGSTWSFAYSSGGGAWVDVGSFSQAVSVSRVGPFAGNSGNNPAFTAEVDYVFDVSAPVSPEDGSAGGEQGPPPTGDTTSPVIADVVVTPGTTGASVAWTTDESTTGSVGYGPTVAYEFGSVSSPGAATAHSLALSGLQSGTVYHYRITARDAAGNTTTTADATFTTTTASTPGQAFGSDDFAAGVLDPRWAVVDPLGDGTVSFVGVGSSDVRLGLGVPAGVSHDAWGVNNSLRVTQSAVDTDFTAVSSFTSVPALRYQSQGLLVEQDAANWLRFDVHHTGATLRAFASRTVGGSSTVALSRNITAAGPIGLRVSRAGSTWSFAYSSGGGAWVDVGSFSQAVSVSRVGPFAGNSGNNPAFTAEVDYVFDVSAPVSPEDGSAGGEQGPPPTGDTTSPVIADVVVTPGTTGASVAWTTDESTTGSVGYGPTVAYEFGSVSSPGAATAHSLALSGLQSGTVYHYRITARDAAGNTTATADATFTTTASNSAGPSITVWYGDRQTVGRTGEPQMWATVLGNVADPDGIQSLAYRVDGRPSLALQWGPDNRRLARPGDFTIEIPFAELAVGVHDVVISAVDRVGQLSTRTIALERVAGSAPLPFDTAWSGRTEIAAVGQVVDGPWSLVPGGGVRADVLAYDRTLAIGDRGWADYEVTVPVTAFALGPDAGTPESGDPVLGLGLHWQGHTHRRAEQPRIEFYPTGAFAWHRWTAGGRFELYGNDAFPLDREARTLEFGVRYIMKARAEAVAGGVAYFYKVWRAAGTEPAGWDLQIVETSGPPTGSVLLISHHVDAIWGDVVVTPLSGSTAASSLEQPTTGTTDTSVPTENQVDTTPTPTAGTPGSATPSTTTGRRSERRTDRVAPP